MLEKLLINRDSVGCNDAWGPASYLIKALGCLDDEQMYGNAISYTDLRGEANEKPAGWSPLHGQCHPVSQMTE